MSGLEDRRYWVGVVERIGRVPLEAAAARELKARMPTVSGADSMEDRSAFAHLETVGRYLCGIAPWLEVQGLDGAEETLRAEFADLARQMIASGCDPDSPDFLNFSHDFQPIVDAAFLAHALLRAPRELWQKLDPQAQANVVAALKMTRTRKPGFSNWLLFAAIIEAFLYQAGSDWDPMRIDYAVRQHEQWYLGDGLYGDGPEFHWDYYNSFVIQPMLIDVLETVGDYDPTWAAMIGPVRKRAQRYAVIQERLISPEGTFPAIGRSLAYRFGAFQSLAQTALRQELPAVVTPGQVRCALTAVIRRMIEMPGTFDDEGWLQIGFAGHQSAIGEHYISTGSVYLCAAGLLPLGLPPEADFWSGAPAPWTQQRIWAGENVQAEHALRGR